MAIPWIPSFDPAGVQPCCGVLHWAWMRIARAGGAAFFLLSVVLVAAAVHAQPVEGAAPVSQSLEDQPLNTGGAVPQGDDAPLVDHGSSPDGFGTGRVVLALGVVIGLIFLLRWGGRRLYGASVSVGSTSAVSVLSRSIISPKQHVVLVQVGRRVLVLGDNGTQMRTLAEVRDPDEVAELVGLTVQRKAQFGGRSFSALFRRQERRYDGLEDDLEDRRTAGDGVASVSAVVSEDVGDDTAAVSDESVQTMQKDLRGLVSKVKQLSSQFQR